ncbi:MAG: response regulator, partial [bacterium]
MRILIVDDEKNMCRILADTIREKGHFVRESTEPRKALEIIEKEEFDLVVTDLKMP